jgi:hypothetical protein
MRQAQARKISDAYLDAPKRSERHLHVVSDAAVADPDLPRFAEDSPQFADPADSPRVVEDLRVEAPAVDIPDWAEPFADPRWDDRLGYPDYEERDGRRTVLVTGRPEGKAVPRREATIAPTARKRRQSPTRARLAGRPDRVALWAVALGLVMAAMAGFTGNSSGQSSSPAADQAPAPLVAP